MISNLKERKEQLLHKINTFKQSLVVLNISNSQYTIYPVLTEDDFKLVKNYKENKERMLKGKISSLKNEIRKKAELSNIAADYDVESVNLLTEQIKGIKEHGPDLSSYHNYTQYISGLESYQNSVNNINQKLIKLNRAVQVINQVIAEAEWADRYVLYAAENKLLVDHENLYRKCNRHRLDYLVSLYYPNNKAEITVSSDIDNCIGYIESDDPEIFISFLQSPKSKVCYL